MSLRGLRRFFIYVLALPKSLYVNARLCPQHFFRMPLIVSHRTKLANLSGNIEIPISKIKLGLIRFGFGDIDHVDSKALKTIISCSGKIIFRGKAKVGAGSVIYVGKDGTLDVGENFKISTSSKIICDNKITIGCDVLVSWDVLIMDSDQHQIFYKNESIPMTREIKIDNNNWICCRAYIGKGVYLPQGIIVAANAVVTKSFDQENVAIAGNPAIIVKKYVTWKE